MVYKIALYSLLLILSLVLVFHVLVIVQLIPYTIVWAGKLKNTNEMYVFESISIIINSILLVTILQKATYINLRISAKVVQVILWIFSAIFMLNTIGNLFAEQSLETIIFTPLTFISSILCYIVVRYTPKQ